MTFGDVVVVAPDSPQSGMGHAITINNTLYCEPIVINKNEPNLNTVVAEHLLIV